MVPVLWQIGSMLSCISSEEIFQSWLVADVSFKTRNLCTFLLCLFQSIISSLVNDYYLISFLFQSVSFKYMYQILYFIFHRYKLLSMPSILSAIHVQSAIGDLSTISRSYWPKKVFLYFTFKIFPFFDIYIDLFLAFSSLYNCFIVN